MGPATKALIQAFLIGISMAAALVLVDVQQHSFDTPSLLIRIVIVSAVAALWAAGAGYSQGYAEGRKIEQQAAARRAAEARAGDMLEGLGDLRNPDPESLKRGAGDPLGLGDIKNPDPKVVKRMLEGE